MNLKIRIAIPILVILLSGLAQAQGAYSGSPTASTSITGARTVPLTIKIVLIGFQSTDINNTYLVSRINIPDQKQQGVLASSQSMGSVTFNFTYQPVFADASTVSNLVANITTMSKTVNTVAGPQGSTNPSQNPYFNSSSTNVGTVANTFYDANKVEALLNSEQGFGSSPIPGYTLFIADLHSYLPSLTTSEYDAYQCNPCLSIGSVTAHPHYYNITVKDPDLGLVRPRPFMTGWGGSGRSSFIDLSAGPSDDTGEPPIQVAQDIRTVGPPTYLLAWRTQYVADYVSGAVFNLFGPDQLYSINYSAKYVFHLFVYDARPFGSTPPITSTVNASLIKSRLSSLVPFANVSVIPEFRTLASDPGLSKIVTDATTTVFDGFSNDTIVDARVVYNWLNVERHLSHFINATYSTDQIDIPEFIFAFGNNYEFGFTFKSDLVQRGPDSIFGVALGDLVLIGHSEKDFNIGSSYKRTGAYQPGKGVGFSNTIIHESGHELGLVHPFSYDPDEDFVNSVMAYYPGVNTYSQFDRDLELRGINDELLIYAQVTMAKAGSSLLNSGSISASEAAMATAEQKYNAMDYEGAVSYSLMAAQDAANAQAQGGGLLSGFSGGLYLILGILLGTAIGVVLGFLVFHKRSHGGLAYYRCPTCNRALRWDPAMGRWYCDYCQKPV